MKNDGRSKLLQSEVKPAEMVDISVTVTQAIFEDLAENSTANNDSPKNIQAKINTAINGGDDDEDDSYHRLA